MFPLITGEQIELVVTTLGRVLDQLGIREALVA
jgi:hypothetical protein